MAGDRKKLDWWFNTNTGPKLWVQRSSAAQGLPAPTYQNAQPEAYELEGGPTSAQSVTSEDATTVRENGDTEEHYCAMSEAGADPTMSHEEGFWVVHDQDHGFEMIMSGTTTPHTSTAAEWGSGSSHSLASTFELVDKSQSLSDVLRDTGAWMPSLPRRFLSNCQLDYPTSSFWRVTISRAASSPPGHLTMLYSASLCILTEPLSKSMPLLRDYQKSLDSNDDDIN